MIDSQRGAQRRVGYNHLISNKREWNNCFIKNPHKISFNLPDQNKPEKTRDFRYSHVTRLSKLSTCERTRLDCMNEKSKHCSDEHQFLKTFRDSRILHSRIAKKNLAHNVKENNFKVTAVEITVNLDFRCSYKSKNNGEKLLPRSLVMKLFEATSWFS